MSIKMKFVLAIVSFVICAIIFFFSSGCAGPGKITQIKVRMPNGDEATIVAHNQSVPDWMLAKNRLALNFAVKTKEVSSEALAAVAEAERACRIYTNTVRPNDLVAVLSSGVLYAAAGAVGIGVGSRAFQAVDSNQYAKYGAYATGFAGIANGIITLGGKTYTFENCGREVLGLSPEYQNIKILQKSPY